MNARFVAPTMAEIRLKLARNAKGEAGDSNAVAWLVSGLNIEQAQYVPHIISSLSCSQF
jgi:hypothetical protein